MQNRALSLVSTLGQWAGFSGATFSLRFLSIQSQSSSFNYVAEMQNLLLGSLSSLPCHPLKYRIMPYHFECGIFGAGTQIPNQQLGLHALTLMVASGSYHTRGNYFFHCCCHYFLFNDPSFSPICFWASPSVHLSLMLAPLGASLSSRRDVGVAGTAGLGGFGQELCSWVSSSPGAENPEPLQCKQ